MAKGSRPSETDRVVENWDSMISSSCQKRGGRGIPNMDMRPTTHLDVANQFMNQVGQC